MRIIQVQTQAEAAGAQRVSDLVGAGLRRRGHDVRTVFMYRKTSAYDADPHADFILNEKPQGLAGELRAASGLFAYLRRARPDAVISYQHFGNVFGTVGGRLAGARVLVANQSGVPLKGGARGIATHLDRWMGTIGLYHHNVVNSAWTAAQFADYPAAYRARLRRIDHGVVAPEGPTSKQAARQRFGLPAEVPLVVSTGRLNALKNHVSLVDALAAIPTAHLAIAGEGPEREAILARAEALQVTHRVHLVGELPPEGVFEFLAAGDVFGFASEQETFGLAVVEAAIAGLPVVAYDLAVLREVLGAGDGASAAEFVVPQDVGALAASLRTALETGAVRSSASLREELADRYSVERMCDAYDDLLR
jgi:glycosyltransferase involved in cell wall biosynthesis